MKDFDKALENCETMLEGLAERYTGSAWLLRGLIHESVGHKKEAEADFESSLSCEMNSREYLEGKKTLTLEIFPPMNRLCVLFPFIELEFKDRPKLVISQVI